MAKGPSKARESRVNIQISDRLKGGAEPELPFRMLVMGDYTLKGDNRTIEEREPLDINKSNFDSVMQSFNLSLDLSVPDRLSGKGDLPVNLKFGTLKDFRPESIARQVPQLKKLLELRDAMKALRPKLGDKAAQKELMGAVKDPAIREQILGMISQASGDTGAAAKPAGGGGGEAASSGGGGETPPSGGDGGGEGGGGDGGETPSA